jgi:hypothetical protein
MSEQLSPKAIIAESIIENFEAISSYVVRQSLRDMLDENKALRTENVRLKAAICDIWNGHGLCEDHGQLGYWKLGKYIDLAIALQPERGRND